GIFDRTLGAIGINLSGGGSIVQVIGNHTHDLLPLVGDYNGDGKADPGIFDRTLGAIGVNLAGGGLLVEIIGGHAHELPPLLSGSGGGVAAGHAAASVATRPGIARDAVGGLVNVTTGAAGTTHSAAQEASATTAMPSKKVAPMIRVRGL